MGKQNFNDGNATIITGEAMDGNEEHTYARCRMVNKKIGSKDMSNQNETTKSVTKVGSAKVIPTHPDGYADHLSGDWNNVPNWAIARINFLEEVIENNEKLRCPLGTEPCPNRIGYSCSAIKHCYPYLCDGCCGKTNEVYVTEKQLAMLWDKE